MPLRMSGLASNLQAAVGEGLAARRARRSSGGIGPGETRAENCPICMDVVTAAEWRWPVCRHIMHEECWQAFLGACMADAETPRCPTCRRSINGTREGRTQVAEDVPVPEENEFEGERDDPLFPSLYKLYSADMSNLIAKHHPKGIIVRDNELFESYGLRHTFKPRYLAAGVDEKIGMYLFGHSSKETSQVHENYAKGARHETEWLDLQKQMLAIHSTQEWATLKEYSDFDAD